MIIQPQVLVAIAAIFGVLVFATVASAVLARLRPQLDLTEVDTRIRTWWAMVLVVSGAIAASGTVALCFFAFLSFLAFKEYLSLIPTRRADRRVLFWAYLSIPIQYYWVSIGWYGMFIIFIPVYLLLFLPMRMILIGETAGFLRAVGTVHWGLMMTVFCVSHMAYMLETPLSRNPNGGGAALVLFLLILTQLNDVAQFCWGKTVGKTKVVPQVSPGKTYGGLIGGLATTTALAPLLGSFLTPFTTAQAVQAGAIIGMSGFIGDVVISALKRDLGIKDSGAMLPGHGGILDRLDSLLYTAPLFFHFAHYLDVIP